MTASALGYMPGDLNILVVLAFRAGTGARPPPSPPLAARAPPAARSGAVPPCCARAIAAVMFSPIPAARKSRRFMAFSLKGLRVRGNVLERLYTTTAEQIGQTILHGLDGAYF